ncbi:MAG: hypothetical protein ACFE8F_11150, partial [Promethearchaeota archaeon]
PHPPNHTPRTTPQTEHSHPPHITTTTKPTPQHQGDGGGRWEGEGEEQMDDSQKIASLRN